MICGISECGDDDTADGQSGEGREVGLQCADGVSGVESEQQVEAGLSAPDDLCRLDAECSGELFGHGCGGGCCCGKVEDDSAGGGFCGEYAAAAVELDTAVFPVWCDPVGQLAGGVQFSEYLDGGDCGMSAEVDFGGGCEPAESEAVWIGCEEGGFCEVHFSGDLLQPLVGGLFFEQADGCGVAFEGVRGEGIDLEQGDGGHGEFSV